MQGEAAGAQAFSNFDTFLAPYIRYDQLDYKQIKQCLQEFLFNLNVPTRVGFQTPFTNITMDLTVPDFLKNEPIVHGGEIKEEVYGDFQAEVTLLNKAFAEVMYEGDASGSLFSFPIPTYNITPDFDWNNPEYEGIWEMTAKYGDSLFFQFREFRYETGRCPQHVLPFTLGQTGIDETGRRTVCCQPAYRVRGCRYHQSAPFRL